MPWIVRYANDTYTVQGTLADHFVKDTPFDKVLEAVKIDMANRSKYTKLLGLWWEEA